MKTTDAQFEAYKAYLNKVYHSAPDIDPQPSLKFAEWTALDKKVKSKSVSDEDKAAMSSSLLLEVPVSE